MGRPKKWRRILFSPKVRYFKPQGIPMSVLEEVVLEKDELEAVRLCDLEEMDMLQAGNKMQLSKSTVHRLLQTAHRKISLAIVEGKAIKILE